MKRHTALADLSRDHHHGLVMAKRLEEAAADASDDELVEVAERFVAFWDDELAAHFTEEEHVLLPVYQRHVDLAEDDLVQRMLADHAWFRDAVPGLVARLDDGADPREAVARLGERLREHARFEDRELFPEIEEALGEDELETVHERSIAFRRKHRGEAAIGPRPSRNL